MKRTRESNSSSGSEPPRKKAKQVTPAKKWVFTDHDASEGRQDAWRKLCGGKLEKLAFQVEIGEETKKEHLQGCFVFKKKGRGSSLFKGPHFEKQRGTEAEAVAYATKEDTRKDGVEPFVYGYPEPLDKWTHLDMCKCQTLICDAFRTRCDKKSRTVNWFWESQGGWGKTEMALYLVDQHKAIVLQGASKDCLHGIKDTVEKTGACPPIVIFDVPRVNAGHVSYQSIEAIKNGLFFSGKYESAMCRFNRPHVIVFSNQEPEIENLSEDRWNVVQLQPHDCKN